MSAEKFLSLLTTARKASANFKARRVREVRQREKLLGEAKKLTQAQANELAARLDGMIEERAQLLRGRKSELTPNALDTKELYRLTLPADANPTTRRVRLSLEKYLNVVSEMAAICGEDPDDLQYELLQDTEYDVARQEASDWHRQNVILRALNVLLKRLDRKNQWSELFQRTADLRLKYGARCTWPLEVYPDYWDEDDCEKMTEALADPEQVFFIQNSFSLGGDRPGLQNYFQGGHTLGPEFFFVPHALIGHMCLWDMPQKLADPIAYSVQRLKQTKQRRSDPLDLLLPEDNWDEVALEPKGQKVNLDRGYLEDAVWLVVYPDPLTSEPVPALYQPIGISGDVFLAPLNKDTLLALADAVWLDKDRDSSLADRLLELLTPDEAGISAIERSWGRTGSWLQHNPVLKAQRADRERLKAIYKSAVKSPKP